MAKINSFESIPGLLKRELTNSGSGNMDSKSAVPVYIQRSGYFELQLKVQGQNYKKEISKWLIAKPGPILWFDFQVILYGYMVPLTHTNLKK
jgi:hypothetical protein